MKIHPAADLFPMMGEEELQSLAEDIAENGLQVPVRTYKNMILDGRARFRACELAGVTPQLSPYEGNSPYTFSIEMNLRRRHLTPSQRAAIAADAREQLMVEAKKRNQANRQTMVQKRWDKASTDRPAISEDAPKGRSREIAGRMFGVGHAQVGRAWEVKEKAPELFEEVKKGTMSVGKAYRQVHEPDKRKTRTALQLGDALEPLRRYLKSWDESRLQNVTPKEAKMLLTRVQEVNSGLFEVERALDSLTVVSRALR